jgi:hypothetical protein
LKTLRKLEDQAVQQGWITDLGVAKGIDAKLRAAGAELKEHKVDEARQILRALLHCFSVEAGKHGEHLSAEAVALLYVNTEYLLSHI